MNYESIWQKYTDDIFGPAYQLQGLPRADDGGCARRHGKRYIALAFINGQYMSHVAGSVSAAMRRLNAEIDKRSIGLFGIDDLTITT